MSRNISVFFSLIYVFNLWNYLSFFLNNNSNNNNVLNLWTGSECGHASTGESSALGFFFLHLESEARRLGPQTGAEWIGLSQPGHVNVLDATQHFGDTDMGSSVRCQF